MAKIRRNIKRESESRGIPSGNRGLLSRRIRNLFTFLKPVSRDLEVTEDVTTEQNDATEETATTENTGTTGNNGSTTSTDPGSGSSPSSTNSDMEPLIGEIKMFAGNYAPRGWAFCEGQLLEISNYSALYSILGTTYGGNGTTTFGLPDLRGRVPLHPGQGPGLSDYLQGQSGGHETVTLDINQIPTHNHSVNSSGENADSTDPSNRMMAQSEQAIYGSGNQQSDMNSQMIGNAGNGMAHNNMQPYLAVNFIIALEGIYPSRT